MGAVADLLGPNVVHACFAVGLIFFLQLGLRFLGWIVGVVTRARKPLTKYGEWAVVTGASDGIGKAYAMELAKSKLNIVLISRTKSKLDTVAKEIEEATGVMTKVVPADLADSSVFEGVEKAIKDLDIGILVNNAGMSYEYPDWLVDVPDSRIDMLISLNITALTKMSKIVLKGMSERKRGAIINLSSISGVCPMSLLTVYAATKTYVDNFSQALDQEYGPKGIFVQSLIPAFVSSAMSKQRPSLMVPTPHVFAKSAVNTIGNTKRTSAFFWHDVQRGVLELLPNFLTKGSLHNLHVSIRKRAIRKKEKMADAKKD